MGKIETATQWMIDLANDDSHGYDQDSRWGPDYDCSSSVISAWQYAGVPVKTKGASSTYDMKNVFLSCGFTNVISSVNVSTGAGLKRGDVLHRSGHTAMYIGNNKQVAAHLNEKGTTKGGKTGDQTGKEISVSAYSNSSSNPWTAVLRYTAEAETTPTQPATKAGEWIQGSNGKWWYRHTDGTCTKSDWELIDGSWYYFDADGWMMTGWVQVKGKWYYLLPNGVMAVNTWVESVYYVGSDGAMLTNKMTPDGYIVNSEGKWDGREPWVKRLQIALKDAGYNPGTIDGVAGSNTLAACPTLKSGSKGTLVTLLQERLYYFFGLAISGGIDGDFGTGTKNAVISFQKNCGLSADGIVGTNTWRKLLSL